MGSGMSSEIHPEKKTEMEAGRKGQETGRKPEGLRKLYGVTVAMVTPFDDAGRVDVHGLSALTKALLDKGVNCLYPCGTTGEMVHLSVEERKLIAETVIKAADARGRVFIHCGAMKQEETAALLQHACEAGADGAGIVTPVFLGVNAGEMERYYETLSGCVSADFPIYLYNIPQCAGNDLTAQSAARIVERCPNVVGIKYSYPDMLRTLEYLAIPDFSVLHGCDKLFSSLLMMGCDGTVSGVAGVFPEPFAAVYRAWQEKDIEKMQRWQKICVRFCDLLRCGSNMSYFKEALKLRGIPAGGMRLPQRDLERAEVEKLNAELRAVCEEAGIAMEIG